MAEDVAEDLAAEEDMVETGERTEGNLGSRNYEKVPALAGTFFFLGLSNQVLDFFLLSINISKGGKALYISKKEKEVRNAVAV